MMRLNLPVDRPKALPPWSRRAFQYAIAVLFCFTALDTSTIQVRPLRFCLSTVTGTVFSPFVQREPATLQPVAHALRVVSGLVIKTSRHSKAAAVRMATIIGFRG